jgi:CDP-diacylglycerol--serine O-phosphatidyltransferase
MPTPYSQDNRMRGIYLLPNLFTTAGLFTGFYAIVAAMKGNFEGACIAVFIAMIADALDGRVARLTNTQSAFGAEYDSLADMVSFGVAPAIIAFTWALSSLGKFGWLIAFFYVAGGALRLARFNTQMQGADKRYFQGLAIPAAAGLIVSMVWAGKEYEITGHIVSLGMAFWTTLAAVLMVSNIRYSSFKSIDLKGRVPFVAILCVVLIYVAISIDPPKVLCSVFLTYSLSGPILTLWNLRKKRLLRAKAEKRRMGKLIPFHKKANNESIINNNSMHQ